MRTYSRYDFEEAGLDQILRLNPGWDVLPLSEGRYRIQQEGDSPYVISGEIHMIHGAMGKLLRVELSGVLQVPGEADVDFEGIEAAENLLVTRGLPQAWRTIICLSTRSFTRN